MLMLSNNVNLNDVLNQLDVMHVDNHQDHLLKFSDWVHILMKYFDHANEKKMELDLIEYDYTIDTIFLNVE